MGCDIHPYLEGQKDGEWFLLCGLDSERNYMFFARLSDVRNYNSVEAYFTPVDESIAAEFSDILRKEYERWGADAHSLTVMDYEDLLEMRKGLDKETTKVIGSQLDNWLSIARQFAKVFDKVRAVAWYDN